MRIEILSAPTPEDWMYAYTTALLTEDKIPVHPPTDGWKKKLIKSEHSPLYTVEFSWEWADLPYWVSVHLVRHHEGIVHFVQSQRNDRQHKYDRNTAPQGAYVTHRCTANVGAIIGISRKRMCRKASDETRAAWGLLVEHIGLYDQDVAAACVPNCVYRNGLCPEFHPCEIKPYKLSKYRDWFLND